MLEFYFGSVAILLYVRRKAGWRFRCSLLMLWAAAPTLYYAVEARPYALIFLSFTCLLLAWDRSDHGPAPAAGFIWGGGVNAGFGDRLCFAPFTLFAFLVAEGVRFRRRRKPDYPLWAALLLPMLSMLSYIPLIRVVGGLVVRDPASYNSIILFFAETFAGQITVFVLLSVLLVPLRERPRTMNQRFSAEEIALFVCMVLSPFLLNLVLMRRHVMFYNRYCVPSQVAILVALAVFLAYRVRLNSVRRLCCLGGIDIGILKIQVWHPLRYPASTKTGALASVQPDLPIVVGEGRVFMEMNQYENAALLSRLYFLKDQQASLQFAHTNYLEHFGAPDILKKAGFPFTANVAPYSGFVLQHRRFLLLGGPRRLGFPEAPLEWSFYCLRTRL